MRRLMAAVMAAAFFILVGCMPDLIQDPDLDPTPTQEVMKTQTPPPPAEDKPRPISGDIFLDCLPVRVIVLHATPEDIRSQAEPCGFEGFVQVNPDVGVAPWVFENRVPWSDTQVFEAEFAFISAGWGLQKFGVTVERGECYLLKWGGSVDIVRWWEHVPSNIGVSFYQVDSFGLNQIGPRQSFPHQDGRLTIPEGQVSPIELIQPFEASQSGTFGYAFQVNSIHAVYDHATVTSNEFGVYEAPGFCG